MTARTEKLVRFLVLPLFGVVLGLGLVWLAQAYFWGGSIRGARTVTALSRQILGRDPTPKELAEGIALWRKSPDALFKAARDHEAQFREQADYDYGLAFVDQGGRALSRLSGPLKLVLDPFTIYANVPNQRTKRFTIDEHGFRATPRRAGKPLIVVLGGSTAFGYNLPSDDLAFPWLLAQRLPDFDVVNAGVVGYLSGQELALMIHRLDRLRPAAYVVFDGWNDLVDQHSFSRGFRKTPYLFGFNNQFFEIERRLYAYHTMTGGRASPDAGNAPGRWGDERANLGAILDTYVANVTSMHAFATARGARFVVVFQPELGNKQFPSDEEKKSLKTWNPGFQYAGEKFPAKYAQMVRSAREYCATAGIPFSDPQQESEVRDQRETLFYDPPHLNERGHVLIANILERRLRTLLTGANPWPRS